MKRWLIFLAIVLNVTLLHSQFPELIFEKLSMEDGLSSSVIKMVQQDSTGYLWIATDNGLNRYDGYEFKVYNYNEYDSTSISSDIIGQLYVDHLDNIWIGAWGGSLCRYIRETDNFKRYTHNPDDPNSIASNLISPIYEDKNNDIWIGTYGGLCKYDRDNDQFINYSHNPEDPTSLSHNTVSCIYEDNNNNFWVCTWGGGLNEFNRETGTFIHYKHDPEDSTSISHNNPHVIHQDNKGRYWVGTWGGGLNQFDPETGKFKLIHSTLIKDRLQDIFTSVYEDPNGNIWLGSSHAGLLIFNPDFNSFKLYIADINSQSNISNEWVNQFYVDNTGILWITTNWGLNKVKYQASSFENYTSNPDIIGKGLSDHNTTSIYEDEDKIVWIGTHYGGLNRYDPATGSYKYFRLPEDKMGKAKMQSISFCVGENDDLWICSYRNGVFKFNKRTTKFAKIELDPGDYKINTTHPRTIARDTENNIWVGYDNAFLLKYSPDKETYSFMQLDTSISIMADLNDINAIVDDKNGNLWLSVRNKGLYKYNRHSGQVIRYKHEDNNPTSLSSNDIYSIIRGNDGILWLGVVNGLNRFDPETEEFLHYNAKDGLPSNKISNITEDNVGNIWLGINSGVIKFNPKKEQYAYFDKRDGIQVRNLVISSYYSPHSKYIYFSGHNGFIRFKPGRLMVNKHIPNISLVNLEINKRKIKIGEKYDGNTILKMPLNDTKKITLSYKQNSLSIDYAALHFKMPQKNHYEYKLEGYDKDWHFSGNNRRVTYLNLKPGKYIFRVKGANSDGIWNEKGASLAIYIAPPWWKHILFKIILSIVICILIISVYLYRTAEIKGRQKGLESLVSERMNEINRKNDTLIKQANELEKTNKLLKKKKHKIEEQTEELISQKEKVDDAYKKVSQLSSMKDKFLSIIGHDLKTPINLIVGFSDLLRIRINKLPKDKRDGYIQNISESAKKTYRLLENLLEWSRSQGGNYRFNPTIIQLIKLVNSNIILLKEQSTSKNIAVQSNINESIKVFADYNMLDIVLRNLISNAIKFTPNGGKINISCNNKVVNDYLTVYVKDTGIGIPKGQIDNLFRIDKNYTTHGTAGETGTGLGLLLCKEFVEKNGGSLKVFSEEGKGSSFYFTLPNKNGEN